MKTKASILGHPLHAILIVVPLGAVATNLVFDALFLWRDDAAWYLGGFVASVVAAVGFLVAIVPGLVDYYTSVPTRGPVRKHATVHMLFGLSLTGYFIASAAMRWATLPAPGSTAAWSAFVMSAIGIVGLAVQGYLGGGLVLTHQIGVDTNYLQELPPPYVEAQRERERRGPFRGGGSP